jgi:hypothetical protein
MSEDAVPSDCHYELELPRRDNDECAVPARAKSIERIVPKRPPIFMAYDLKQSPRDSFTQYGEQDNNLFTAAAGLQNADLVKLSKVFRYTPEIARFLEDLDATFPAIDIPGEWDAYAGEPQLASGNTPELVVFKDERSLFKTVFGEAVQQARRNPGGGRRVAVL